MISFEQRIAGTWRSYKLFHFSGKVEVHNTARFVELSIDQQGCLTMCNSDDKRRALTMSKGEWKIEELKKRKYLFLGKRQAYEIITVEAEDLVLADPVKGEKLFFARMPEWNRRIEPVITSIRHIRPSNAKEEK